MPCFFSCIEILLAYSVFYTPRQKFYILVQEVI